MFITGCQLLLPKNLNRHRKQSPMHTVKCRIPSSSWWEFSITRPSTFPVLWWLGRWDQPSTPHCRWLYCLFSLYFHYSLLRTAKYVSAFMAWPDFHFMQGCGSLKHLSIKEGDTPAYHDYGSIHDFPDAMVMVVETDILDAAKKSQAGKLYGLMMDESTDCSVQSTLMMYVRFVDSESGCVRTHFLSTVGLEDNDAATIFETAVLVSFYVQYFINLRATCITGITFQFSSFKFVLLEWYFSVTFAG